MEDFNLLDDRPVLLRFGAVDHVRIINPYHGFIGRNDHHRQLVYLLELLGFRISRSCHAGQLVVHPEIVLKGDGRQGLVLVLYLDVFLGFQGLMQPLTEPATGHQAAGELIHDDHLLLFRNDIVHVALEKLVRLQGLTDVVKQLDVFRAIEIFHPEGPFRLGDAAFRQGNGPGFFVDGVIVVGLQPGDDRIGLIIEIGRFFRRPRNDQRRPGLVDKNTVHFVHNGVM